MDAPTLAQLTQEANVTNESQPGARFNVESVSSVFEESAPLEFLVNGLITKGSVNLLVGEGGSKKTWAALDLAVCVARGADWLDFPTQQTSVLIVDEESGPRRLRRRLYEVLNGHLIKRDDETPLYFTSLNLMDLRNLEDVNALHVMIEQYGAGLVVIDALADVMPGADENAVKDVQPVFMNLRRVAETTQAAIVIIHHANKQNGYRGSTAIKGAVDLMLMVESQPESKYINFSAEKARDIEPRKFTAIANFAAEASQVYLSASDAKHQRQYNKGQRYVMRFLVEHGGEAKLEDIIAAPDTCAPATAKTAVYSLADIGNVKRTDQGGRGSEAVYTLTDKGREAAAAAGVGE